MSTKKASIMLELIAMVFLLLICASFGYTGMMRSGGRTRITRPTEESAVGMGGARARDYSYVDRTGKGFPVGLKQQRGEKPSFKEPRRKNR
ncbi:MAG: hypothetical protein ACXAAO_10155 [Candidatus Thorarchaeota archaeon]